jgi:NitT/TauT family transport system permease protein
VTPTTDAPLEEAIDRTDAVDGERTHVSAGRSVLRGVATRVAALAIFVVAWQLVVVSGWKPEYLLPSPFTVLDAMWQRPGAFTHNAGITLGHAAIGIGLAAVAGVVVGVLASFFAPLRAIVRSIVAGMDTVPAVVWYPAALIVIGTSWYSILLVVVIGGAPPIARGVIDGVDRTARRTSPREGAQGGWLWRVRHVVVPGALPDVLLGLRRGWRNCWAALLTGEVLLLLPSLGLGGQLLFERGLNDNVAVYEVMVVIFVLGWLVDGVFGSAAALLPSRRGIAP